MEWQWITYNMMGLCPDIQPLIKVTTEHHLGIICIENRIYREELKESLGMNFFSPFQTEREFKVYKSCKCSQIICSRVLVQYVP